MVDVYAGLCRKCTNALEKGSEATPPVALLLAPRSLSPDPPHTMSAEGKGAA